MYKKGQLVLTKEMPKMIFYAFFMIMISFVILFIFGMFIGVETRADAMSDHLPINMILVSPNCLAYSEQGRVYPGIVDFGKLNQINLEKCFTGKEGEGQGVELNFYSLENSSLNLELELNVPVLAKSITCGLKSSDYRCYFSREYVLYFHEGSFKKGFLDFSVVSKIG